MCYNLSMIFKKFIEFFLMYSPSLSLLFFLYSKSKNVQFMILCCTLEYYMLYPKKRKKRKKNKDRRESTKMKIESFFLKILCVVFLFVFKVRIYNLFEYLYINYISHYTNWCAMRNNKNKKMMLMLGCLCVKFPAICWH